MTQNSDININPFLLVFDNEIFNICFLEYMGIVAKALILFEKKSKRYVVNLTLFPFATYIKVITFKAWGSMRGQRQRGQNPKSPLLMLFLFTFGLSTSKVFFFAE